MSKEDFKLTEDLQKMGYDASIAVGKEGLILKIKATADEKKNGKATVIDTVPIALAQKHGYKLEEINVEQLDKDSNKFVPVLSLHKRYEYV